MIVSPDVTLDVVRAELVVAARFAAATGIVLDTSGLSEGNPQFVATFVNATGDRFFAEFDCVEYPLHPPTIEFVNADRSERKVKRLYPAGFHGTPCICMRYNRSAYTERGGPHGDWRLVDWRLPTGHGVAIDSLAMMLSDLEAKIRQSTARME